MVFESTVTNWNYLSRNEPFWAVLTRDEFRGAELTIERKKEFYQYPQEFIDDFQKTVQQVSRFDSVLDFGCGLGRLSNRLSEKISYGLLC